VKSTYAGLQAVSPAMLRPLDLDRSIRDVGLVIAARRYAFIPLTTRPFGS